MNNITTKSGIEPINVDFYSISQHDVTRYLQNNVLGIKVLTDYMRWNGKDGNVYVRMRLALNANDITDNGNSTSANVDPFVNRCLRADGSQYSFKEDVIKKLEPYMYSPNIKNLRMIPGILEKLADRGIYGDGLDELIANAQPHFARLNEGGYDGDYCAMYLSPERIIKDMIKDAATDKVNGKMTILAVTGGITDPRTNYTAPISWKVFTDGRVASNDPRDVSIDEIFNNIV